MAYGYLFRRTERPVVNGEPVQLLHTPSAHTDGDSLVMFRRSDVGECWRCIHARPVPGDRFGKGGASKG